MTLGFLATVFLFFRTPGTPVQDRYGASLRPLTDSEKRTIDAEHDLRERLAKEYATGRFDVVAKRGDAALLVADGQPSVSNGQQIVRAQLGNLVGRAALRAGDRRQAIRAFRWAKSYGDDNSLGDVLQGFADLDRGDLDAVRARIAAAPSNVLAVTGLFAPYAPGLRSKADLELRLNLIGMNASRWANDEPLSQSFVERAAQIAPKNPYVLHLLATVRSRQGRIADSLACLKRTYAVTSGTLQDSIREDIRVTVEIMNEAARAAKAPAKPGP